MRAVWLSHSSINSWQLHGEHKDTNAAASGAVEPSLESSRAVINRPAMQSSDCYCRSLRHEKDLHLLLPTCNDDQFSADPAGVLRCQKDHR